MQPPRAMPLRILLSLDARERHAAEIGRVLAARDHRLVTPDDADAAQADIALVTRDVTGLSTKHEVQPDTQRFYDLMLANERLRWVHIHSAGVDRPVYVELARRGVEVTPSSGANAPVVAQTTLLGLLALARHWPLLARAQREHRWASLIGSGLPRDLQGQRAVVVGWGPVGQEIGRLLLALGLRLVVVRRSSQAAAPGVETLAYAQLRDALPSADWLVLACPLTAETRHLVGRAELGLLPAHAGLVNVSRGDVVDEAALIEALVHQRIGGAYLDVFAHEPLPAASPLWDLPNVIATPHSAGFSDGNEARVVRMFMERLAAWTRAH